MMREQDHECALDGYMCWLFII